MQSYGNLNSIFFCISTVYSTVLCYRRATVHTKESINWTLFEIIIQSSGKCHAWYHHMKSDTSDTVIQKSLPSPSIWRRKNWIPAVIVRKVMYSTWCRNLKMTYLLQLARKWLAYYPNSENGLPTSSRKWHSACLFTSSSKSHTSCHHPESANLHVIIQKVKYIPPAIILKVPDIQPAIICEVTYCLTIFREW